VETPTLKEGEEGEPGVGPGEVNDRRVVGLGGVLILGGCFAVVTGSGVRETGRGEDVWRGKAGELFRCSSQLDLAPPVDGSANACLVGNVSEEELVCVDGRD
jgi:hypothetical protein